MSFALTPMFSMSPCPRAVQLTIVSGDWSWQMSTSRPSNWLIMKAPNAQRMSVSYTHLTLPTKA